MSIRILLKERYTMKNVLHQTFYLNNVGTGEKEFFKIPDYIQEFILDNRQNYVFGEVKPIVNFTLLYDQSHPKYRNGQYLAIRSYKAKRDELLDSGYAFAGTIHYGENRTNCVYAYAKIVQLD